VLDLVESSTKPLRAELDELRVEIAALKGAAQQSREADEGRQEAIRQ
jgi:hypothetical protein